MFNIWNIWKYSNKKEISNVWLRSVKNQGILWQLDDICAAANMRLKGCLAEHWWIFHSNKGAVNQLIVSFSQPATEVQCNGWLLLGDTEIWKRNIDCKKKKKKCISHFGGFIFSDETNHRGWFMGDMILLQWHYKTLMRSPDGTISDDDGCVGAFNDLQ